MKKTLLILATVLFQLNSFAQYTAIPDPYFEAALRNLGYDSGFIDGQVLTANINTITSLDVSGRSISDLTGIQDFGALQTLNCQANQLTSLNWSALTTLTSLSCGRNNLKSLNLSGFTALTTLYCDENGLTSLDVSGCTALTDLYCPLNPLKSLNVSGLTALSSLSCNNTFLLSLNVSGLTALRYLNCSANFLTSLNLSGLTALRYLNCTSNPSLSCIQVDNIDAAWSNSNFKEDVMVNYSLNCNLASNSYEFNNGVVVFPNPTQSILTLSTTATLDKIIITDLTGKTVLHQTLTSNQVNVQHLAKGMYILQAYSGKEKFQTKFIKE